MVPGTNLRIPKIGARHHFFICALFILIAYVVCCSLGRTTHGFIAYYGGSRLLVNGELGPAAYDDTWFTKYVQRLTATGVIEVFRPNPPPMALIAIPVVWFGPLEARAMWLTASLAALAVASSALLRSGQRCLAPFPVAATLILLLNPAVFANLRTGQVYLFLFATFTAVALALIRGRDALAGVLLGLALALKTSGLPLMLLLVVGRRFRAVVAALVVWTAVTLVVTPFVDLEMWRRYPAEVWDFLQRPAAMSTGYQATQSLFRRLCIADPQWNPSPAGDCAGVAQVAPALITAIAVLLTLVLSWWATAELWIAAGVCLSVLVFPVAQEEHFALLGLPLVLLIRAGGSNSTARARVPLWGWLAFAALFLIPLESTAFRFTDGWSVLAAYPRVYAAWLLWGFTVWAMFRSSAHPRAGTQSGVPHRS